MKLRPSLSSLRYDMFTLASPSVDGETFRASDWNLQTATCSGGATLSGVEYHHVSSVSVGATANLLVASRELSTVWSLAHDGSGVQWTLSSQLESDFVFARAGDEFFQPHDVTQLANGNLLVVDDGSNRPGCFLNVQANCFSRAVMYSLDPACDDDGGAARGARDVACNRTAHVVWQAEFPLQLDGEDYRVRNAPRALKGGLPAAAS